MEEFNLNMFGIRLKEIAKKDFGGIGKLADKMHLPQAAISNYTKKKNPREPKASMLFDFYKAGVDVIYLLTGAVKMGEVKEPAATYSAEQITEELAKLRSELQDQKNELEKVKARNYDLIEENKNLWEAVTELGQYNQVLTLLHAKANHHLSNAVDPPL